MPIPGQDVTSTPIAGQTGIPPQENQASPVSLPQQVDVEVTPQSAELNIVNTDQEAQKKSDDFHSDVKDAADNAEEPSKTDPESEEGKTAKKVFKLAQENIQLKREIATISEQSKRHALNALKSVLGNRPELRECITTFEALHEFPIYEEMQKKLNLLTESK